jgi:hypothetical protein
MTYALTGDAAVATGPWTPMPVHTCLGVWPVDIMLLYILPWHWAGKAKQGC